MKKEVEISFVIPCFNPGVYLSETIQSILNQEPGPFSIQQIIIVNDRSTDPITLNILEELSKTPGILVIDNTHARGPGGARNCGAEKATADWLAAGATDAENPQLSSSERECCTSLANHPYFLMNLFDNPGCLQPLLALRHSVAGVAIMRALGKGLYYKSIESDPDLSMLNKARLLWLAAIFILSSTIGSLFKTRSTGKVHG